MIYLDYAATTPMSETAIAVYTKVASQYFGNPSSLHDAGSEAKQILEASRATIAKLFNADANEIYFTGGGSDGNRLALEALLSASDVDSRHVITTKVEHSSVRNFFNHLEEYGYEVTRLNVDSEGRISLDELEESLRADTILASIQHVNSETGVIQDLEGIGALLKARNIFLHSDCVQSFCKIDVLANWADAITVSAHKVYGPKGVGAVYIKKNIEWQPEINGTTQERGLRAGTQNVPGIAAFAAAAKGLFAEKDEEYNRIAGLRAVLLEGINAAGWTFVDEGIANHKLSNILGLRFPGIEGQFLMLECSQAGLGISTGSACQAGLDKPNGTMLAMGRSVQEAREFVRLSLGKGIDETNIPLIIEKIDTILSRHFSKVKL